jgi:Ca-activated chloride channel family protein
MTAGIDAALALPHDPARLRIVAFVTDGYVGNEDEILKDVSVHAGASRLFAFGVGSAVNRYLLDELASIGRGTAQFVRPDEDTRAAVDAFHARIDAPILTDIAIDWAGLAVTDVTPRALPDLFAGQPLVVSGHYTRGGIATVIVHGRQDGRDVSFAVPVTLAERDATRPAIATVWARQRIAELSRELIKKDDAARVAEIIELSIRHKILTQYTAFVAVDDSRKTAGDAKRVVVPVEIPAGVTDIAMGGGGYGYGSGSYSSYGSSAGAHYTVHYAAVPTIRIGQPMIQGDLDKSIIKRYVKRHLEKITYCYEKELLAKPTLDGTVVAQFLVGADGKVLSSTASGVDEKVASCIADVIKAIDFPAATGGIKVEVNYPFTLHPNVIREENR